MFTLQSREIDIMICQRLTANLFPVTGSTDDQTLAVRRSQH